MRSWRDGCARSKGKKRAIIFRFIYTLEAILAKTCWLSVQMKNVDVRYTTTMLQ